MGCIIPQFFRGFNKTFVNEEKTSLLFSGGLPGVFSLIKLGLTLESLKDLWYDKKKRVEKRKYPCPVRPERPRHRLQAWFRGKRGEVPFGAAALNLRSRRRRETVPLQAGKGQALLRPAEFGWYREEVTSPLMLGAEFFCPQNLPRSGRKVST